MKRRSVTQLLKGFINGGFMAERAEVRSRAQERLEKIEDSGCCSMVGEQHKPVAGQEGGTCK